MKNKICSFTATNGKTFKGLLVGHFMKVNPIPYFDKETINKYLTSFNEDDLTYLIQNQILGIYCPFAQRYILGDFELPKVSFEGKTYFCFALDMHFELKK